MLLDEFVRRDRPLLPACDDLEVLHRRRALQDAGEGVIIGRRHRIKFVIVAAGAPERQSHKSAANRIHLLVDNVHLHLDRVILGQHLCTQRQKAGGGPAFGLRDGVFVRQQIPAQLFQHEPVERFVGRERANHVVAVAKGIGVGEILVETIGVGIADDVQPVTTPPFGVSGRAKRRSTTC